jgi:hypothetical protein
MKNNYSITELIKVRHWINFFVTKNVTLTKKVVKHKNLEALKLWTLPLEKLKQPLLQWHNKSNYDPSPDF